MTSESVPAPDGPTKVSAYCVKCRRPSEMVNTESVTMSNGKKAMRGRCVTCGTGMYKILGGAAGGGR